MGTTLAEKVWADHLVRKGSDGAPDLLYIDLMLMHEVTSPQAFEGLRLAGRKPRHVDQLIATEDHNTPTVDIDRPNPDETSALQLTTLEKNCKEFGVRLHPLGDADQGIVHAFAPILGLTQPGMTIVCGDSHTSTHGAFGALAFGIGTSEVEHVMATQTLSLKPFKTMAVNVNGKLPADATAKDIILAIIAKIGTGGGQGYVIEYRGEAIRNLTMDERMTVCNMSIEAGARAGMIAPDETTFEYLKGRPHAPEGELWDQAVAYWKTLKTDDDAVFDKVVDIDATKLGPYVTWGTNPGQGLPITASVPEPGKIADATKRAAAERALTYMGLKPGMPIKEALSIAEQHLTTLVTYADNFSLERDDSEGVTQPLPFDLDIHAVGTNGHHHVDSAYALVSKTDELTPQTDEPIKLQWFSGEDAAALIATTRITISRVQYALARHQDAPPEHE